MILVVEDDPLIRETLMELLQDEGFGAASASNGEQALEWLRTHERPHAILLDLMMPVMNGWEFRQEQQEDPALAEIPMVVVSGAGDVASQAKALGAAAYICKPINFRRLLQTVRDVSLGSSAPAISGAA